MQQEPNKSEIQIQEKKSLEGGKDHIPQLPLNEIMTGVQQANAEKYIQQLIGIYNEKIEHAVVIHKISLAFKCSEGAAKEIYKCLNKWGEQDPPSKALICELYYRYSNEIADRMKTSKEIEKDLPPMNYIISDSRI